ncbi:MAG: hypothetical protein ACI9Y7_001053 [Dokdonia sp.]|jgi:hypothetical protein
MKKAIALLFCIWYTLLPSISQNEAIKNETSGHTNFSGRHCRGTHGLCSISEEKNMDGNNTVIAYDDNTVTFTIDRNLISTSEEIQIVGRPILTSDIDTTLFFTMDDDFTLSTTLANYLETPSQTIIITKGSYPVYVTKEELLISFKL